MFTKEQIDQLNKPENSEAKQNLIGFFGLLLQIDKRNNPKLYEIKQGQSND